MLQNKFNTDEVTNYPKSSTEFDSKLLSHPLKKTKQNKTLLWWYILFWRNYSNSTKLMLNCNERQ